MSQERKISQTFSTSIEVVSLSKYIYADNAATTKLDDKALEAMLPWLREYYGNASQPYSFAREPKKALADARATIATCINAEPEEIFFTSGGTESDNWVIKGRAFSDSSYRATVTSSFEHHAVLRSCAAIEQLRYPVAYMLPTNAGYILPETLRSVITNQTGLVSVMYANNELGSIQPIRKLCDVAHAHGALFHTDAVQVVGHVKIDVRDLGVDFLSASAHKFNGPKGVGFLYVRKGCRILPYADGGAQEFGLRAGTENIAGIVGMATALKVNCDQIKENEDQLRSLEQIIIKRLDTSGILYFRNGGEHTLPGLISLSFPGKDGEAILHRLDLMGICISTGSACDSKKTEISHVLRAIRLDNSAALGTVRVSLGKYNMPEEAEKIAEALIKVCGC